MNNKPNAIEYSKQNRAGPAVLTDAELDQVGGGGPPTPTGNPGNLEAHGQASETPGGHQDFIEPQAIYNGERGRSPFGRQQG